MSVENNSIQLSEYPRTCLSRPLLRNRSPPSPNLVFLKPCARLQLRLMVYCLQGGLIIGFLCLGNTDFFKSDAEDAQQVITSSLRDPSQTLKRTILEIFQEYFATEDYKAEATEGRRKEDIDLTSDIGVLTGTASSINTDEYLAFISKLTSGLHSFWLEIIWVILCLVRLAILRLSLSLARKFLNPLFVEVLLRQMMYNQLSITLTIVISHARRA